LVGDIANQNFKPFIEGNLPSIICGDFAGKISYNILQGKQDIHDYKTLIVRTLGPMFKASDETLQIMLDAFDNNNQHLLNILVSANICSLDKTRTLFNQNKEQIIETINEWNNSKMKQFLTQFIEKYYLLYLYLWRKTRLL
jgi:hypothetical protein